MSLVSNYLTLTVAFRAVASSNVYGEPTYGSSTDVRARIEQGKRVFRTAAGNLVTAETTLWVEPDLAVAVGAQFQVRGEWHLVEGYIIGQGLNEPAFKEVYLRRIA